MSELTALAALLTERMGPIWWAAFLVFLRVGGVMALLPAFGEQSVPMRVRLVLTLAFTAVVLPAVVAGPGAPVAIAPEGAAIGPAIGPALAEAASGLVLGAGFRLMVMILQVAGTMAAQATSLSQLLGGIGAEPQPAIAQLLMLAGMALAIAAGMHVRVAEALILSYEVLPAGRLPDGSDVARWGLWQIGQGFAMALALAAPFLIGSLLYNVALGAINRAMPQLMVAFVGAPAITAGALVLLMLTAPAVLVLWLDAFARFAAAPLAAGP